MHLVNHTTLTYRAALLVGLALYSVGLSAQLTVTLTGAMYNGTNVPCFGKKEGTITSSVTGGTAPYTYFWSTGATTTSITAVPAGYYLLTVKDAIGTKQEAQITLTEPEPLNVFADPYVYPNGKNISCFECYNGSIDVQVIDGTPPYTYSWQDAAITTQDRTGLGAKSFEVTVTDANGCVEKAAVALEQPESSDWTMSGNANTNPATQYFGTSDNKDVVFKANGQEALRLLSTGEIRAGTLGSTTGYGLLVTDSLGTMKRLTAGDWETYVGQGPGCPRTQNFPWLFCGNHVGNGNVLGATNPTALKLITDNEVRLTIDAWGKVGIGTTPPMWEVEDYRLFVEDGIVCRDVLVKLGEWPDYVFELDYALMPLSELRVYLGMNKHLPGIPSEGELEDRGGVAVGEMQRQLLRSVEEQALYILELEEKYRALEKRMMALEHNHR